MPLSVDTMISNMRNALGVDSTELSTPDAVQYLNRSFWELLNKFPFRENEKTYTFNTVRGTASYTIPASFDAIRSIAIEDVNSNQFTTLELMDPRVYDNEYVDNSNNWHKPTNYYREDDDIVLWPTPDLVYGMTVRYWMSLADLAAGGSVSIPREWDEVIEYGGRWRWLFDNKKYTEVKEVRDIQVSLINSTVPVQAKEMINTRTASVSAPGYRRRPWK